MAEPPDRPPAKPNPSWSQGPVAPSSSTDVRCPTCGAPNSPQMIDCWMCRNPMNLAPSALAHTPGEAPLVRPVRVEQGWFIGAVFASLILVIVFFEMLYLAPGGAVIFGIVAAPLIALMLRLTWPQDTTDTRRTLAIALVAILSVIGLGIFVLVSGAVLFSIICGGIKV